MEIILKIIGLFVAFVLVVIAFKIALFLIGASLIPGLIVGGLSYWYSMHLAWFHDRWQHRWLFSGIIGQFSNQTTILQNSTTKALC